MNLDCLSNKKAVRLNRFLFLGQRAKGKGQRVEDLVDSFLEIVGNVTEEVPSPAEELSTVFCFRV